MPNSLFIRFREPTAAVIDWLIIDEHQEIINQAENTELATLPPLGAEIQIIALIPSSALLLLKAKLPKASPARLLQAVPYAVEEQIATDIENMHFALGEWQAEGTMPVVAISHAEITYYLQLLMYHGLQPNIILPDVLAIPYEENSWSLVIEQQTTLVRTGWQSGFTLDTAHLNALLPVLQDTATEPAPSVFRMYNYTQEKVTALPTGETQFIEPPPPLLPQIAKFFVHNKFINLLQNKYQPKIQLKKIWKDWRRTAILLSISLGFFFFTQLAEMIYLKIRNYQLDQQISVLYQKAFPNAKAVIEPQLRLQQELTKSAQLSGGNRFLNLLAATGMILQQYPEINLLQVNFQNNQLIISIQATSFTELDNFRQSLQKNRLQAQQNAVNRKEEKVIEAQFTVSALS